MNTLNYILKKYAITFDENSKMPIQIPDVSRDNLAELFRELDFRTGAEIGVAEGFYSEILRSQNPQMTLYGIDPYIPHHGYRDYARKSTFEKLEKQAHEKLDKFPNYEFVRKFSMEAVKDFSENSLDFVYIDGDHSFQSVTNDIIEWSKKVKPGGIISGHDYYKHRSPENIHVYRVVNAYTEAYRVRPWFVLGADQSKSWFWIK